MAAELARNVGREVLLARANLALSRRAAARLAGVSPTTQRQVEEGKPSVRLDTLCTVGSAVGLKVWGKAFPVRSPSLRDAGQLKIADHLRSIAHPTYRVALEIALGNLRSIDMVFYGALEIIATEIERQLADLQAQYRAAATKRDELAALHQRPVRLVLAVEDTRHNRAALREHAALVATILPAGTREIVHALRTGRPLARDGLLWVRLHRR